jgi:HlyD family type I secretion membrane fusion protein
MAKTNATIKPKTKKTAAVPRLVFVPRRDGKLHRLLLLLMVLCVAGFWGWAALSSIDQQVRGQGSIVPSGQAKVIQHLEGGIVTNILVEEGQQVDVGQSLFRISNQQAESDSRELQLQAASIRLQIRRLEAERDGNDTPNFTGLIANAPAGTVDNEQQIFRAHTQNFRDNLNILQDQVHQKELKLEDSQTQLNNLQNELKVANDQLAINERLREAGAISETRYLQSKSAKQDVTTRVGVVEKSMPVTRAEMNEALNRIKELSQKHSGEILDDLRKAQLALGQIDERMNTPDDKIRRTTVTSPIRGIVNKLFITTVNGVVKPGDRLVEIVPLDDKLIIEARVPTKDRGLIWNGLPTLVKISAYDYAIYGGIKGKVIEISPDTLIDEHGAPYYRVRVSLEKNKIADNLPLFPGMTADVNILSGKITILQYLLRPIWNVKENALREAM